MLEKIKSIGDWKSIKQSALTTVGLKVKKEPDSDWKLKLLISEHSPIRKLRIEWLWKGIKSWIATHFVRHNIGINHFISTQRDDRTGLSRDDRSQGTLVNHECEANAQAIINISRKRLCSMAHKETKFIWEDFKWSIKKVEPELYQVMVPECIYRGGCPEFKTCGFFDKFIKHYLWSDFVDFYNIQNRYAYYNSKWFEQRKG